MDTKINNAITYYKVKQREILNVVNSNQELSVEDIIHYGEEMAIIEYKITSLEVAKAS